MNHPISHIVSAFLLSEEIPLVDPPSVDGEWPLFLTGLPDMPSNAVALHDTQGEKKGRILATGQHIFSYGLQISIRSVDYLTGWRKAQAIQALLETVKQEEVIAEEDSYLLDSLVQTSPVLTLGPEQGTSRRELFTINYVVFAKALD